MVSIQSLIDNVLFSRLGMPGYRENLIKISFEMLVYAGAYLMHFIILAYGFLL